jgi:hypothetical protein
MIDPKLNEAPVAAGSKAGGGKNTPEDIANLRRASANVTLDDTVAANANLSVGARGVDTSGVSAGAGAGAGMTAQSASGSLQPNIVPGARGTGTTPLGPSGPVGSTEAGATEPDRENYSTDEIAAQAYQNWCERGCPEGSPEIDWYEAERQVRERKRTRAARA